MLRPRQARPPRAVAFAAAALSVWGAGCAAVELEPGENPALDEREGLVAIVIDAPTAVDRISFSPDDGGAVQVNLLRVAPADDLRVLRLPTGRYCLDEIEYDVVGMGYTHDVCFEVAAQVLRYPGHLVIERVEDANLDHQGRFSWVDRPAAFAAQLRRKWPGLAEAPPRPPEDDFVPPEPASRPFDDDT